MKIDLRVGPGKGNTRADPRDSGGGEGWRWEEEEPLSSIGVDGAERGDKEQRIQETFICDVSWGVGEIREG